MKHKILTGILLVGVTLSQSAFALSELESATKLANMGVIKTGTTAEDFGLNQNITRKEMMKIVMNLSGKNVTDTCNGSFSDVPHDWGCKYIETALNEGFIAHNTSFRPNDSISKAEAMKLILKARGIEKAYNTSSWQDDYMKTALDTGLISSSYSDHNNAALRRWIFSIGAAEEHAMMMKEKSDTMMKDEEVMMKKEGVYTDYDASLIGQTENTVLFFHAAWCPSCRSADSSISNEVIPDGLTILKTDFDSNTDLRKKYGVTSQHTFVQVDANGELITKWSGSHSIQDIQEKLQ